MSYFRPGRAMGGVATRLPAPRVVNTVYLGSLGDDPQPGTTLSQPTINDATWQASVLARLDAGVKTLERQNLQKWLQIAATLSIPLAAAVWRAIFKRGSSVGDPTT